MFRDLFEAKGYTDDGEYDWQILKRQKLLEQDQRSKAQAPTQTQEQTLQPQTQEQTLQAQTLQRARALILEQHKKDTVVEETVFAVAIASASAALVSHGGDAGGGDGPAEVAVDADADAGVDAASGCELRPTTGADVVSLPVTY